MGAATRAEGMPRIERLPPLTSLGFGLGIFTGLKVSLMVKILLKFDWTQESLDFRLTPRVLGCDNLEWSAAKKKRKEERV